MRSIDCKHRVIAGAITVYLILLTTILSYSQPTFGIKAGVNLNNTHIKVDPPSQDITDRSTSFHVGVFTNLRLGQKLSFVPEVQFIKKGYKIRSVKGQEKIVTSVRINYIEVPLIFSYKVVKFLSVEAGPDIALRVSANAVESGKHFDVSDSFKALDLNAVAGLRIHLSKDLSLVPRYSYGLTTIEPGAVSFKEYNRNFLLSVAYTFNTGD